MHPFYDLSRKLVRSFAPEQISLFYANDHLAVSFAPGCDLALNGTTFRKVFRQAGLDSDWFAQQPCQKLSLMWSGPQGEYHAAVEEPAALDASLRAERVSKKAAPQALISLLFESLKTDAPVEANMWPYLLGIPVHWNGTQYKAKQNDLIGFAIAIGNAAVHVAVSSMVEEVTLLHMGEQITAELDPIKLPILILVQGEHRPTIEDVLGFTRRALRHDINKALESTSHSLEDGILIDHLAEIIKDPLLKKLLAADKKGLALATFAALTGLGMRWEPQWGLDENGDLRYWTEPSHVISDPVPMAVPSSILTAVLPASLPIVPEHSAPHDAEVLLPEVTVSGEYPQDDGLGYLATSIRAGEHELPHLVSFGESRAIVNGTEDVLAPGLYLVRGHKDFKAFWEGLVNDLDLLRLYLVCVQMMIGGALPDVLEDALVSNTEASIDAELVASFILKNEVVLEDWRERKAAGLLHKTACNYPLMLRRKLIRLVEHLHSQSVRDMVWAAIELSAEERFLAFEQVIAEAMLPQQAIPKAQAVETAAV